MDKQRTFFQKCVLVILAAMMVLFGAVTAYCQTVQGILFRDKFLRLEKVTDADCFTGKVEGEQVTILCWYGSENSARTITLRVGERIQDTYTVYLGLPMISPAAMDSGSVPLWDDIQTLRITKNDEVIYEGGYREKGGMFFTSDGKLSGVHIELSAYVSGADPWKDYTMPKGTLVTLALGPKLIDRGDWRLYGLMVFLTLVFMVDVAFPYTIFRWRYRWKVKNPEPTEDYMSMQHLAWIIVLPVLLVGYLWAATTTIAVV